MGGAVFSKGNARMGRRQFYVGVAVSNLLTNLIVHAAAHELGERRSERHETCHCQTAGNANHIGLRDATFNKPVGELLGEVAHLNAGLEVGREGQHLRVFPSCQDQTRAESAAGVLLTGICILFHTSNLLRFP